MTNTTTDAAEARAREDRAKLIRNRVLIGMAMAGEMENSGWEEEACVRAMIAFATAEAASGVGEREEWSFTPDTREAKAVAQLSEEQELSPQAVMRQALRLYQSDFLRRKAGETVTWSGDAQRARDFAGPLASLSLATDPAMGLDPATVERCAKVADAAAQANLARSDELKKSVDLIDIEYSVAFHRKHREAASIANDIRALAAAPTIPATGERECPSSPDGRHQVDTSMESGPNNCFHCEAPMGGK